MKYRLSKDVAYSELDGEICLFHSPTSEYLSINRVGSFIWNLMKDQISSDEILYKLMHKYDVDEEECKIEINKFLNKGKELGIFEELKIDD